MLCPSHARRPSTGEKNALAVAARAVRGILWASESFGMAGPEACAPRPSDQRPDEYPIGKLAAAAIAGNCIQKIGAGRAIPAAPAYLARLASLSDGGMNPAARRVPSEKVGAQFNRARTIRPKTSSAALIKLLIVLSLTPWP